MPETKRTMLERMDRNLFVVLSELSSIGSELRDLGRQLLTLAHQTKAEITMANQAITELVGQFNEATNNIAARIDRLIAGLNDQVTGDQLSELTAIRDHLTALGQDPSNPVPNPVT